MTEPANPSAGVFNMAVVQRFGRNNVFHILTSLNGRLRGNFVQIASQFYQVSLKFLNIQRETCSI